MTTLALLLVTALVLAACGTDEPLPDPDPGTTDAGSGGDEPITLDGDWILASATVDGTALTLNPGWRVTMTVSGSEVTGRAACNSYFGDASIGDGTFSIGAVGQTEMGCEQPIMQLESDFLGALTRAMAWSRAGDRATLTGDGVELAFEILPPVPTAALVGTTWLLDTIIQGEAARSTIATADDATLRLEEDGTFTGGTGCRSLAGEYVVTGDTVQFTSFGADGDCPDDLVQQDSQVITVLEGPFTVAIDGSRLTITSPGAEGLGYLAQP